MTSDGPGGQYNGSVLASRSNADGTQTLQLAASVTCIGGGDWACLPPGLAVAIMRGTGTGQLRRLVSVAAGAAGAWSAVTVDAPFAPMPASADSFVSITQYNGGETFEASTWVNGTVVQTYGMAVGVVLFNNTLSEMFDTPTANTTAVSAGVRMFGHRYMGGYETNWHAVIDSNVMSCTSLFYVYSDNIANVSFSLAQTVRGNVIAGGANLSLDFVWDSLMEGNSFSDAYCAYAGATLPAGTTILNASSPGTLVLA